MDEQEVVYELRELRKLYAQGQIETVQRLTAIETQMTTLIGDGQTGRIGAIETDLDSQGLRVTDLEAARNRWMGAWTATSIASALVGYFVTLIVRTFHGAN